MLRIFVDINILFHKFIHVYMHAQIIHIIHALLQIDVIKLTNFNGTNISKKEKFKEKKTYNFST